MAIHHYVFLPKLKVRMTHPTSASLDCFIESVDREGHMLSVHYQRPSKAQAKALAKFFSVSPELFI